MDLDLAVMDDVKLIEPMDLYNLIQRAGLGYNYIGTVNFLFLIDARIKKEYNEDHIATAKNIPRDESDQFMIPYDAELESKQHIVIYDGNSSDLSEGTQAVELAKIFVLVGAKVPVKVLAGGYERFTALYHFLRTQKIIYTIKELENFRTYPVEIMAGLLFLGNWVQGNCPEVHHDLRIKAHINCHTEKETFFPENSPYLLHVPTEDDQEADIYALFREVCDFAEANFDELYPVLIFDRLGFSRSATLAIAILMFKFKWTLEKAFTHTLDCRPGIRPNIGFLEQLSQWEEDLLGNKFTDPRSL